jgi:hypothetical protein
MMGSLAARCTNYAEMVPKIEENGTRHGVQVANVLMNVASCAMFEAFNDNELGMPGFVAPDLKYWNIEIKGQRLSYEETLQIQNLIIQKVEMIMLKMGDEFFYFTTASLPIPSGQVVNLSHSFGDTLSSIRGPKASNRVQYLVRIMASYINMIEAGKLLVFASGNESAVLSSHKAAYSILRNLAKLYPRSFIIVNALSSDGMTLTRFGNQPGDHELNQVLVCAPGKNIPISEADGNGTTFVDGTSFAAPFVSGIAAILLSNFPDASSTDVCEAILRSATPILLRPTTKRLHKVPVALHKESMIMLKSGQVYKTMVYDPAFAQECREKDIMVTAEMIRDGREKYGQGRVNLIRAHEYLKSKRAVA